MLGAKDYHPESKRAKAESKYHLDQVSVFANFSGMRSIEFYRLKSGACPVEKFLDSLDSKQAQKVAWVLELVRDLPKPSTRYFKKLVGTELWEVRADFAGNAFRMLGFFDGKNLIILTSGFAKKTQKAPRHEIKTAENRMKDYFSNKG